MEFYLISNKYIKFELELYDYYSPQKLKFKFITQKFFKNTEISKELDNKSFVYLSDFFKKIDEIYKS